MDAVWPDGTGSDAGWAASGAITGSQWTLNRDGMTSVPYGRICRLVQRMTSMDFDDL
jgi:hypothetical protein